MMIYHHHHHYHHHHQNHHHHDEGGPSQRPGGKQEDDPPPISGKKPNPLSVDPSAVDMRGNLFSPLPNSIRGARDDRCWWETFGGDRGEGGKGYKQLLSQCPKQRRYLSCTHVLSLSRQLKSSAVQTISRKAAV